MIFWIKGVPIFRNLRSTHQTSGLSPIDNAVTQCIAFLSSRPTIHLILKKVMDPEVNIWAQEGENWEWRRLHNEELHSLYRSPNIVRVIKSRRLRWVGNIGKMEEGRMLSTF